MPAPTAGTGNAPVPKAAYLRTERRSDDVELCVAYMGPGGAGHYVKMVHNGIEYALMQLIAESYDIMSRALGLDG